MTKQQPRRLGLTLLALCIGLTLSACGAPIQSAGSENTAQTRDAQAQSQRAGASEVTIPHLHGLGFSADGRQLIVPAHDGLRIVRDGKWQAPALPVNDYMGYAPTDTGFYSSGHPGPSTNLVNPLGIVKSTDGGKTLTTLAFEGESDFHLMGVGYHNHAIYVLNPAPNARLAAGLHYSLDDGKRWQQSAAQGLTSQPTQIAVHATDANMVALATEGGVVLSTDHGASFEPMGPAGVVTAVSFSPDGTKLLFGSTTLSNYDLGSQQVTTVPTPALQAQDAIAYIAVNPARPEEMAIASFGRNIFRSADSGKTWEQIARDGKGM